MEYATNLKARQRKTLTELVEMWKMSRQKNIGIGFKCSETNFPIDSYRKRKKKRTFEMDSIFGAIFPQTQSEICTCSFVPNVYFRLNCLHIETLCFILCAYWALLMLQQVFVCEMKTHTHTQFSVFLLFICRLWLGEKEVHDKRGFSTIQS